MTRIIILLCLLTSCTPPQNGLTIPCDTDPTRQCCMGSPIVVDLAGDGVHLTGPGHGVSFALRGSPATWSWTTPGSDDAWLAMDRDGDGAITGGAELFGDMTDQPDGDAPNGFLALGVFDVPAHGGDADGAITPLDEVWSRLRLWRDIDGDGVSSPRELYALDDFGIRAISLSYRSTPTISDENGNQFRYQSTLVADAPVAAVVSDVWLQHELPAETSTPQDYTQWTCYAWGYAVAMGTDGHGSIYTGPCGNPYTQSDPYVTDGLGQLAKLVIRSATSTNIDTAFNRAYDITSNAIFGQISDPLSYACKFQQPPNPDLAEALPWDKTSSANSPGVKCVSQVISTGGGSSGCQ